MRKLQILIVLLLFNTFLAVAQSHPQGLVQWRSFEEVQRLIKEEPRPVMIDIYTDWCGWCKKMMLTTFSDPQVANYINQHFYAITFNAETRDTIKYLNETFVNKQPAPRGTHQLTYKFLPERQSYPSVIFMNSDLQQSVLVPGYLESKTIAPILVYYKEKMFNDANINEFMAYFDSTFTPGMQQRKAEVKWLDMQKALDMNQKKPKKIMVHMVDNDCISCRVMDSTTFANPVIASYINEHFYPVRFNAESRDTINILNQQLVNQGKYHQLAQAALKNEMRFPSILFFNGKNELITPVPQYMTPKFFEAVLEYFNKDVFTQKQFNEFYSTFKGKLK